MLAAQLLNISTIHDSQIPSLILAEKISPVLAGIFVVIVLLGIFSTAMPLLWMLAHKAGPDRSRKFNLATVALVMSAVVLSVLPFTVLVNKVYGISGYVGIVAMAIVFGRQILKTGSYKKDFREKDVEINSGKKNPEMNETQTHRRSHQTT